MIGEDRCKSREKSKRMVDLHVGGANWKDAAGKSFLVGKLSCSLSDGFYSSCSPAPLPGGLMTMSTASRCSQPILQHNHFFWTRYVPCLITDNLAGQAGVWTGWGKASTAEENAKQSCCGSRAEETLRHIFWRYFLSVRTKRQNWETDQAAHDFRALLQIVRD